MWPQVAGVEDEVHDLSEALPVRTQGSTETLMTYDTMRVPVATYASA